MRGSLLVSQKITNFVGLKRILCSECAKICLAAVL